MFVKVRDGLTKPFVTTTGVKQGCVLSPIIFNLFIMGLPEALDDDGTTDPVTLNNEKLSVLMWADDPSAKLIS